MQVVPMQSLSRGLARFKLGNAMRVMSWMCGHEAMQVIKTWVNSWSTSYRYHEDVLLPCLLGCPDKPDDLQHYIHCPHIWDITRIAFPSLNLASPLDRLCIGTTCTVSLRVLAACFQAYHALKLNLTSTSLFSFDTHRCLFAAHFRTAARASGLLPEAAAD